MQMPRVDEGNFEMQIKEAAPAEGFALAFGKNLGRRAVVESERFVHIQAEGFYRCLRFVKIRTAKIIPGEDNYCDIQQTYICKEGRAFLEED